MTIYYVDSIFGNDGNLGTSQASPWKTANKVNISSFSPADSILFKCGCEWIENLMASSNGTAGLPITYGAYGTGANPAFYSAVKRSGADWTKTAGRTNIYQASLPSSGSVTQAWTPPGGPVTMGVVWYGTIGNYMWGRTSQTGTAITSLDLLDANQGCAFWDNGIIYINPPDGDPTSNGNDYWVSVSIFGINTGNTAAINYLKFKNLDIFYTCSEGFDTINVNGTVNASSHVDVEDCNSYYAVGDAFAGFGVDINFLRCKTYFAKFMSFQSNNNPNFAVQTNGITFTDCEHATNTIGINQQWVGFPAAFGSQAPNTTANNVTVTNLIVSGDAVLALYLYSLNGISIDGVSITGSVDEVIGGGYSTNVDVKNINMSKVNTGTWLAVLDHFTGFKLSRSKLLASATSQGLFLNTCSNWEILYNLLKGGITTTGSCIYASGATGTNKAHNNIMSTWGAIIGWNTDAVLSLKNNIYYNCGVRVLNYSAGITNLTSDYNCGYGVTNWYSGGNLSTWRAASGQDVNSFVADPKFVNAGAGDYRLQTSSPCIKAGVDVGLTTDYQGNGVRAVPSIGAIEYSVRDGVISPVTINGAHYKPLP